MIRYEVFSNVVSSEVGLHDYPVLEDLQDSFALKDVETRFVRQVAREEAQINVANPQFAKGVTVHETAVKALHPETTLKGCLRWAKTVTARPDRGLHLQLEKVRTTNGGGLVLQQIARAGQMAFLTGMENGKRERLVAEPDITLAKIPPEIAESKELLTEYLARAGRPTSFFGVLQQIQELDFLPPSFLNSVGAAVKSRDAAALKTFGDAQVVNVGLISDALERYQKLLEQFFHLMETGEIGGDLPVFFNMLTLSIEFPALKEALLPFTLENKRDSVVGKRSLGNELRIGLARADSGSRAAFKRVFFSLFLRSRLAEDPGLYRGACWLHSADAEETEVLTANRAHFLAVRSQIGGHLSGRHDPAAAAPLPLKQAVFEMVVSLTYQGQYTVRHKEGLVPKKAGLARDILACCTFGSFEIAQLRKLNPNLPVRGVAKNLAGRVPLTVGEIGEMVSNLYQAMYPYAGIAEEVAGGIRTKFREREIQRKASNLSAYLEGSHPLLRFTNYVLGREGQTPAMRSALLAAGACLGQTVLASRDQIKNREVLEKLQQEPDLKIEGYVSLLFAEGSELFPLGAEPRALAAGFRHLFTERVVHLARRFIGKKITYLYGRYGGGLFEVIYQHMTWHHRLRLSRYQLGMILYRGKVLDQSRLKEFGFVAGAMENGHQHDNPWLHAREEGEEGGEKPSAGQEFGVEAIQAGFQAAFDKLEALIEKCRQGGTAAGAGSIKTLPAVLAGLWEAGEADPSGIVFQEEIAKSDAAHLLWKTVQAVLSGHLEEVVPPDSEGEAIDLALPGGLALLAMLKDTHSFNVAGKDLLFRLRPAPERKPEQLEPGSRLVAEELLRRLAKKGAGGADPLRQALDLLANYNRQWNAALQVSMIVLTGLMVRETTATLARPAPPAPGEVAGMAPEKVMCLGMSSSDQPKFHRFVKRLDKHDGYATISQLASWLVRFSRLREEMEDFRDVGTDIREIIGGLNFSVFDAPYLKRYAKKLEELDQILAIRPEDLALEDLAKIEGTAKELEDMTAEIFAQERSVGLRDRWLGKVTIRLRGLRPNTELNFVHRLFERSVAPPPVEGEEAAPDAAPGRKKEDYQTFSERVRNVIEYRRRLMEKEVFVLSPGRSQGRLTINVLDQLFRLKGLFVALLVDASNAEEFIGQLRTRLPPHRLFSIGDL